MPPEAANSLASMLALGGVFMVISRVVFSFYGAFAATMRRHVISRPTVVRWMRRIFAGTYVALAGRLALSIQD